MWKDAAPATPHCAMHEMTPVLLCPLQAESTLVWKDAVRNGSRHGPSPNPSLHGSGGLAGLLRAPSMFFADSIAESDEDYGQRFGHYRWAFLLGLGNTGGGNVPCCWERAPENKTTCAVLGPAVKAELASWAG